MKKLFSGPGFWRGVKYVLGLVFFVPIALLIPKRKKRIVFLGSGSDGNFVDNTKYLYLYMAKMNESEFCITYITQQKPLYKLLKKNNLPTAYYPSFSAAWILLRASMLVMDSTEWRKDFKLHLLFKAKKIQLWHGVGLKRIEKNHPDYPTQRYKLYQMLGLMPSYDLFISTSKFYTREVFSKAVDAVEFEESGYPRNDLLLRATDDRDMINTDAALEEYISRKKKAKEKIVLYAPTFRMGDENVFDKGIIQKDSFQKFLREKQINIVLKMHHLERKVSFQDCDNLFQADPKKDIYPFLKDTELLITDYSSISTDYLFLNKPIIFFPYDLESSQEVKEAIQFDYNKMTPGIKCFDQKTLEAALCLHLFEKKDPYRSERDSIMKMAFEYRDGKACQRIVQLLKKQMRVMERSEN